MDEELVTEGDTKESAEGLVGLDTRVDQDPLVGTVLDGRYLVKRKLGHGGFGAVYLAADEKMMSRAVVVKILLDEKIGSEWSVRKFRQETEALTRIDHPSVVGIFDSGQTSDGKPYIVMQYVDGVSLRSLITSEGMPFVRGPESSTHLLKDARGAPEGHPFRSYQRPQTHAIHILHHDIRLTVG